MGNCLPRVQTSEIVELKQLSLKDAEKILVKSPTPTPAKNDQSDPQPKAPKFMTGRSKRSTATKWLTKIARQSNINICHAGNVGEYMVPNTKFTVDGYCKETNTIYEHYGCMFHGCPDRIDRSTIRPMCVADQ